MKPATTNVSGLQWEWRGELRAVHVGRAVRILKTDLISYLTKEVNR